MGPSGRRWRCRDIRHRRGRFGVGSRPGKCLPETSDTLQRKWPQYCGPGGRLVAATSFSNRAPAEACPNGLRRRRNLPVQQIGECDQNEYPAKRYDGDSEHIVQAEGHGNFPYSVRMRRVLISPAALAPIDRAAGAQSRKRRESY